MIRAGDWEKTDLRIDFVRVDGNFRVHLRWDGKDPWSVLTILDKKKRKYD